ncbi:MAG: hypothetical protein HYY17_08230 [Planctomycetes bacterium]|nr:hypothetical protein [Planctomycetota bacterium]
MRIAGALLTPLLLAGCGIIGFSYPVADDTNPLCHPMRVRACEDGLLFLTNDLVVRPCPFVRKEILIRALTGSEWEIEVRPLWWEPTGVLVGDIWVKVQLGYCGTPWTQPIRIPIFPDRLRTWEAVPLAQVP